MVIHLCSGLFGRQSTRLGSNLIFCLMVVPMSDEFSKVSQCLWSLPHAANRWGLDSGLHGSPGLGASAVFV